MANKFQALNRNVIVSELAIENKTSGGIDLSGIIDANHTQKGGVVESIGELCPTNKEGDYTLKQGDHIVYDKHRSTEIKLGGKTYHVLSYTDIMLVL